MSKFCGKCGNAIQEGSLCPSCEPAQQAQQPQQQPPQAPPQAPPQGYQQPGQPSVVYVQKAPSPMGADLAEVFKKFFSPNPQESVTKAASSNTHIWAIFASINILLAGLAFMLIPGLFLRGIIMDEIGGLGSLGGLGGMVSRAVNELIPFGRFFGGGLLLSLVSFAILCGGTKCIFAILKVNVSFVKVMNLVSVSLLFSSAALAAAILFNFFLMEFSILLLLIGCLGSIVMLYSGIQREAAGKAGPFWLYIALNAINAIVFALICRQIIISAMIAMMGAGMGMMGGMGGFGGMGGMGGMFDFDFGW